MKHKLPIIKKLILSGLSFIVAGNLSAQNISTVAGGPFTGYAGDGGAATAAKLSAPAAVTVDAAGNFYIADFNNSVVRKVTISTGIITTVAGTGGSAGYSGDGGQATAATLDWPTAVALDASGNIYIADKGNNVVRKVTVSSGIITTVAGNGTQGFSGDGAAATAAELNWPSGVAVDALGNIYIADYDNNRVRVVISGTITTICGNGTAGSSGDGGLATAAEVYWPLGLALDAAGDLYISDNGNNRIRMISKSTGDISTIAGDGTAGFSGDGGAATAAEIKNAWQISVDTANNVFIADGGNNRVREVIKSTGKISTIAGDGTAGFSGDGGAATAAELNLPTGVTSIHGYVYIADYSNNRIRKIAAPTGIDELTSEINLNIFPNPSNGQFTITLNDNQSAIGNCKLAIYNILGEEVYTQSIDEVQQQTSFAINAGGLPGGIYIIRLTTPNGNVSKKLVVQR